MTDDATEWVTLRVPEADRNAVRDTLDDLNEYRDVGDQLTYADALTAGADVLAEEHGDGDGDYGFIRPSAEADDVPSAAAPPDADAIAGAIAEELGEQGTDVDTDALADAVAARIDYAELANRTAEEVVGRMQR